MLRVRIREGGAIPYGWKLVLCVVPRVRLRRGKGEAVDSGVRVTDRAERLIHFYVTFAVDGFADQENRSSIFGPPLPQQINRKDKPIEDRASAVGRVEAVNRVGY